MAILGVDDFKSKLVGGGARGNLFKCTVNFPGYAAGRNDGWSSMMDGWSTYSIDHLRLNYIVDFYAPY